MAYQYRRKNKNYYKENNFALETLKNLQKTIDEIVLNVYEITGEENVENTLKEIFGTKRYKGKPLKIIQHYQLYKEMKKIRQIANTINSDENVKKGKFTWKLIN